MFTVKYTNKWLVIICRWLLLAAVYLIYSTGKYGKYTLAPSIRFDLKPIRLKIKFSNHSAMRPKYHKLHLKEIEGRVMQIM